MSWKQCSTPFLGDFEGVQFPFEQAFLKAGGPLEMALFCRTSADVEEQIFLMSPASATLAPHLLRTAEWEDVATPQDFGWALLVGRQEARQHFGIPNPSNMEA